MPLNIGKEMSRVDGVAEGDRQIRRQANSPMLNWHCGTRIWSPFFSQERARLSRIGRGDVRNVVY